MKILTSPQAACDGKLLSCDYHPRSGLLELREKLTSCSIYVAGDLWCDLNRSAGTFPIEAAWYDSKSAIVWTPGGELETRLVQKTQSREFDLGAVRMVFVSDENFLAAYGEDVSAPAQRGELEYQVAALFTKRREYIAGLVDLLQDVRHAGNLVEITTACIFGCKFALVCHDVPQIIVLDPLRKSISLHAEIPKNEFSAISATDESIYYLHANAECMRIVRCSLQGENMQAAEYPLADLAGARGIGVQGTRGVPNGRFLLWGDDDAFLFDPARDAR